MEICCTPTEAALALSAIPLVETVCSSTADAILTDESEIRATEDFNSPRA